MHQTNGAKNVTHNYFGLLRLSSNIHLQEVLSLLIEIHEALYLYNGETKDGCGVKKRQVQEDLKFIESEEGYSMEIDAIRDGQYYLSNNTKLVMNKAVFLHCS